MTIDRSEVSRALAKALAYKACGKQRDAEHWAARLVELLECADIIRSEYVSEDEAVRRRYAGDPASRDPR
jgi:hypothetical protein